MAVSAQVTLLAALLEQSPGGVSPLPAVTAFLLERSLGLSLPSRSEGIGSGSAGRFECVALRSSSLTRVLGCGCFSLG